ncbi:succinate-semialdehyde dehydrogenase, mitochondrial-like [Dendronephthya gigantea]|uniref:succinate-semialdehyde dehydrogenase, mitochondrial-like n=1 Tax=Dendronephthya gigantea TaxID=151771 RepID=UPI001068E3D6|nr:succinate-semialdehyde dehydrogenase, mitochondrial-like [Dendronephthya gigantea]
MSTSTGNISRFVRTEVPYLKNYKAYIGGKWKSAASNTTFPVYNPANGVKLADVSNSGEADVKDAVQEAAQAFQSWKKKTAKERSRHLQKWNNLLMEKKEDIAKIMTLEQGKPLAEAKGELIYGASFIEWFAEEAKRVYGDIIPAPVANTKVIVMKQPIGVAALWTPWNFPLAMLTRKAAAALAAGCTVVCKPAEDTPLTALALAQLAEEAGIPAGVFNIVPCSRDNVDEVTDVVMESNLVTKFSFTGSTVVGKLLLRKCADTVKKVSVELGGNAACIVFNSADVDLAVKGIMSAKFRNTGQTCISPNRIFVQEGIYDHFSKRLVEEMKRLIVGDGLDKSSSQGPLINEKAVIKVERHIKESVEQGAKVICGGNRLNELGGTFFEPTILTDVTNEMPVSREETFGPIAPLLKFENEAEAIAMANATFSGLAGYFYSQDFKQIWRVAEALDVGMVGVNSGLLSSEGSPFGGMKQSGIGTEASKYGINEYIELKSVSFGGM